MRLFSFVRNTTKGVKGFTLIELLVVIAIIGVLSAVVLVSLNSARTKGRDARRQSDISSLQAALAVYADKNGKFPNGYANTEACAMFRSMAIELANGGYISNVPRDPSEAVTTNVWTNNATSVPKDWCYGYVQGAGTPQNIASAAAGAGDQGASCPVMVANVAYVIAHHMENPPVSASATDAPCLYGGASAAMDVIDCSYRGIQCYQEAP